MKAMIEYFVHGMDGIKTELQEMSGDIAWELKEGCLIVNGPGKDDYFVVAIDKLSLFEILKEGEK